MPVWPIHAAVPEGPDTVTLILPDAGAPGSNAQPSSAIRCKAAGWTEFRAPTGTDGAGGFQAAPTLMEMYGCAAGFSQRRMATIAERATATQPAVGVPSVTWRKNAEPAPG